MNFLVSSFDYGSWNPDAFGPIYHIADWWSDIAVVTDWLRVWLRYTQVGRLVIILLASFVAVWVWKFFLSMFER